MTGCTREARPWHRAIPLAVLLSVSLLFGSYAPYPVKANPGNYPVSLYFHRQASKTLDQITSVLWANVTQSWSSTTQTENRAVKSGTPGIWDFYSQPALAGNLSMIAPAAFHTWLSASTTTSGATLTTVLFSVAPSGAKTSLGTTTTTQIIGLTPTEYISTISSFLSAIVPSGYIINLETTISVSSSTARTVTVSYDTAPFPDSVVLTFADHFGVQSISYYNSSLVPTMSFSRNWSTPQRQVVARASIVNSLGLYDISTVTLTVTNPLGIQRVNNASMTILSGGSNSYSGDWQLIFLYSSNDTSGIYQGTAKAFDLSGNVRQSVQFSFRIFALWSFMISVYTAPPNSIPFPSVLVAATNTVGTRWSSNTTAQGKATGILGDDQQYNISAAWEGGIVGKVINFNFTTAPSTQLNMTLQINQFRFSGVFQDANGQPLDFPPSSISITAPNGTTITPDPTGSFYLQDGTFQVNSVLWKKINVAPLGSQFNPAIPSPIKLNIYDLSLAAIQQDSTGLANAKVTLISDAMVVATGTTDSTGVVFFHQIPGGDYVATIQSSKANATKSFTLDRTQTIQVQVSTSQAPSSVLNLSLFGLVLGSAAAGLAGVFGYRKSNYLKFKEHGFDYLNTIVGGTIPGATTLLVTGDAGSGKTLLCEQLVTDWLSKGKPAVYISYQNSPDQLRKSLTSLGLDPKLVESTGKLALVDCYSSPAKTKSSEKYLLENPFDLTALGIKLSQAIKDVGEKGPLVVIDPISILFNKVSPAVVVGFLEDKAARVKGLGGDTVLAYGKGTIPKEFLGAIEATADGILDLSVSQGKKGLVRSLCVRKMRNQAFKETSFDFKIRAVNGIRFLTKRFS